MKIQVIGQMQVEARIRTVARYFILDYIKDKKQKNSWTLANMTLGQNFKGFQQRDTM